ncbi:hypothetical protein RRF57_013325 [Xylaria bambusicola]|uniref:Uncharacterized protein n=1 Tax=Xylaria bambusicola TaxID=326684 RepID=A0AAN7Z581_9PEZI
MSYLIDAPARRLCGDLGLENFKVLDPNIGVGAFYEVPLKLAMEKMPAPSAELSWDPKEKSWLIVARRGGPSDAGNKRKRSVEKHGEFEGSSSNRTERIVTSSISSVTSEKNTTPSEPGLSRPSIFSGGVLQINSNLDMDVSGNSLSQHNTEYSALGFDAEDIDWGGLFGG